MSLNKGKIKIVCFALICFCGIQMKIMAQDHYLKWFPQKPIFSLLEYDLLETQPYSGIFYLKAKSIDYKGAYIPVNLGFRKSIIQWDLLGFEMQLALGATSYTQFEIIKYDANTLRGGLLNTDFKASGFLYTKKGAHNFRMQVFHVSSHLGDDYMLRNQNFELNNKTANYEQLDVTYLYSINKIDCYLGIGEVITPNAFRKRFMLESGLQGQQKITEFLNFKFGSDIKFYAENDFLPDIHSGIGIGISNLQSSHIDFLIDGYYGNLPYSTLDFGRVYWVGLSTRIYL